MELIDKIKLDAEKLLKENKVINVLREDILKCLNEILDNAPGDYIFRGAKLYWDARQLALELVWLTRRLDASITVGPTLEEFGWDIWAGENGRKGRGKADLWEVGCEDYSEFYITITKALNAA